MFLHFNVNLLTIKVNEGTLDEMNRIKLHASLKWCHPTEIFKRNECCHFWMFEYSVTGKSFQRFGTRSNFKIVKWDMFNRDTC